MPIRGYDKIAGFYESAAKWYSLGQIPASKADQLQHLQPGDDVLYVGVGAGDDALLAARKGCHVTCLDLSRAMLSRAEARFAQGEVTARFQQQDVLEHRHSGGYDAVIANYILNSFAETHMQRVLAHLSSLVKPDGKLLIADVAPPQGNWVGKALNRIHVRTAFYVFRMLGIIPAKPTYDLEPYLIEYGLRLQRVKRFRLLRFGPVCYQSLCAVWATSRLPERIDMLSRVADAASLHQPLDRPSAETQAVR